MTKGCTAEACHFRDLAAEFAALGASPVGISMDPVDKQQQVSTLHAVPVPLPSDPPRDVAAPFGVTRKFTRLPDRRATFVIGQDRRRDWCVRE